MKHFFLTLLMMAGFIGQYQVMAVNSVTVAPAVAIDAASMMTVNDFLALDIKNFKTADGRKLGWTKRIAFQGMQKNLAKKVKKGKLQGDMTMKEASALSGNMYGFLSLILSVLGLFIPYLGLAMLVAGLVLGIIGINRDNNPTMAIIGTVLSALFLLLLVIVVIASISWFY